MTAAQGPRPGPIVAIGGGEIREGQTLSIDREIAGLAGKARPHLLFVPTASRDAEGYTAAIRKVYGEGLGCAVEELALLRADPGLAVMEALVDWADIVYVGGGDTALLMRAWKDRGLDLILRQANAAGTILSGLSAGAICWFEAGISDTESFAAAGGPWSYSLVEGLGILSGRCGPHHDERLHEAAYRGYLSAGAGPSLVLDSFAALAVENDAYRVLGSRPGAGAWIVEGRGPDFSQEALPEAGSLEELRSRLGCAS